MTRRSMFVFLAALLLAPPVARAQPGGPGGPRGEAPDHDEEHMEPGRREPKGDPGEHFLKMLDKQLELKPEQKKKIEAALNEGKPEMEKIQKEMKDLQDRMRRAMLKQNERVRAFLDDDQKAKFDEISVHMRHQMQQGLGGGPGQGRGGPGSGRGGPGSGRGDRPFGQRRRPGPPPESENEEREEMGPRDMPPPEMWHEGGQRPPPSDDK